jgi:transposase
LIIKLFDDLGSAICLHFILRWPTLGKVQRASEGVLRKFFYKHNSRSAEKIQERLELIRKEGALTEDEATLAVYSRKVQTLAGLLLALHPQIEAYEKRIKELFRTHPDAPVFSGIPGAGDALSPRLLCAFGTDRARFEMPRNMTQWNGSAPVTISSGQDKRSGQPKRVVTWRWGAPTFIR